MSREIENARRIAAERNTKLDADPNSIGGRWIADSNGSLSIVPRGHLSRRQEPRCTPEQAAAIMEEFGIKSAILKAFASPQAEAADHG